MSTPLYPLHPIGAYHSYLVRLWQERPQTAWRALAQHVQTGETIRFADLNSLFAFLQAQTVDGCDPRSRENEGFGQ